MNDLAHTQAFFHSVPRLFSDYIVVGRVTDELFEESVRNKSMNVARTSAIASKCFKNHRMGRFNKLNSLKDCLQSMKSESELVLSRNLISISCPAVKLIHVQPSVYVILYM